MLSDQRPSLFIVNGTWDSVCDYSASGRADCQKQQAAKTAG